MKKSLVLALIFIISIPSHLYSMKKAFRGLSALFRSERRLHESVFNTPSYNLLTNQSKQFFSESFYNNQTDNLSHHSLSVSCLQALDHEYKDRHFVIMKSRDPHRSSCQQPLVYVRSLDPVSPLAIQNLYSIFGAEPFGSFKRVLVAPQDSRCNPKYSDQPCYNIWNDEAIDHIKKAAHLSRRFSSTLRRPLLVAESLGVLTALKVLARNPTLFSGALFINPIGDMDCFMQDNPWFLDFIKNFPDFKKEGEKKFYKNNFDIRGFASQLRTPCVLIEGRDSSYHADTLIEYSPTRTHVIHMPGEFITSECSTFIFKAAAHYIGYALKKCIAQ